MTKLTFVRGIVEEGQIEVISLTQIVRQDDLFLEVEHRDAGAIEGHLGLVSTGSKFVKHGGCHMKTNEFL